MNVPGNPDTGGLFPRSSYRVLPTIYGVVTLVTFGTDRFLTETAGQSLGNASAYVMSGVALGVAASSFRASVQGRGITTAVLLALGPVGGLAVYLLGYHLVLPPSTDSPTWLLFLVFAGGSLALGTVAHLVGSLFTA